MADLAGGFVAGGDGAVREGAAAAEDGGAGADGGAFEGAEPSEVGLGG